MNVKWLAVAWLLIPLLGFSQSDSTLTQPPATQLPAQPVQAAPKKWFENIQIRGYAQVRYNGLFETNPDLGCEQCDRSWGGNGGFFIRRTRVIIYGQIHKRVYLYIQPDFANSPSSDRLHFAQLRDMYFDVGLDDDNEFRFRIGQSKIPYGFENMQSSQNRIPLDRNDALNSAIANERDLGVMFYWAPKRIRALFKELVDSGLKGSGDYGVLGLGIYNGQTANTPELNKNRHVVARLTYPFTVGNQIIETGIQGYTGKYVMPRANLSQGVKFVEDLNYIDQRVAATFVLYPKPFGIQTEYNIGRGPEFNKATETIEVQKLTGGYVLFNYKTAIKDQLLYPFIRAQYYDGGKKHERDARSYLVRELEIGVEWQPFKNFELVPMYTISSRRYEDFQKQNNFQTGRLLRLQAQVNF
ncbi:porin [Telluribacter sp. SYSU D00476]|uniref:porin n=1 Tax=Telluribacter sp. SYSU D00476 TaxID=2811430 RepID=UPI001FF6730B|nr:porin [Telluribacter sp. SYSU D00476]